jgi:hypothetical protein
MKTTAIELIAAERERQISAEGWTPEHDQEFHGSDNALLRAAGSYLKVVTERGWVFRSGDENKYRSEESDMWWPHGWDWKPKDPVRDLVRAAALIAAEIDRLQRATPATPK